MSKVARAPWWAWTWPALAFAVMIATIIFGAAGATAAVAGAILIAAVFAAVHHAEVVANRVGEPFGTLVLALAVTIIEVALIVSVMLGVSADKAGLARDTVFSVVMIVCNGIVGLCLLSGGVRHHEQGFQVQGASAALAVLAPLTILTMVVPNFTVGTPGPAFSTSQLAFAAVISLVLYGSFVFVQTMRHRDYFLPPKWGCEHARRLLQCCTNQLGAASRFLGRRRGPCKGAYAPGGKPDRIAGAPKAMVGVAIAMLVLMPESLAALGAARANQLQTSLNLALGSALASIGLTIPAVAVVSIVLGQQFDLGLHAKESVLLALTCWLA